MTFDKWFVVNWRSFGVGLAFELKNLGFWGVNTRLGPVDMGFGVWVEFD